MKVLQSGEGDKVRRGSICLFHFFLLVDVCWEASEEKLAQTCSDFHIVGFVMYSSPRLFSCKACFQRGYRSCLWTLHMVTGRSRLREKEATFFSPRHSSLSLTYFTAKNSSKWKKESSFFKKPIYLSLMRDMFETCVYTLSRTSHLMKLIVLFGLVRTFYWLKVSFKMISHCYFMSCLIMHVSWWQC